MSQDPLIPLELSERLDKALGHINAVERHLWDKTDRGIWSGHQAMARAAEMWLWLQGAMTSLPPIERYLPREVLEQRLTDLADAGFQTPLASRLQEIDAAEAAILAEPFTRDTASDRGGLQAGLARQHRYLSSLRDLLEEVETVIADRYIALRPGDWALVPGNGVGRLIVRRGLAGWFLIPSVARTDPDKAIIGWSLDRLNPARIEPDPDQPITAPTFYAVVNDVLDAVAKAWLIEMVPGTDRVLWSQIYAQQHVPQLAETAPATMADPLVATLRRNEDLSRQAISNFGRMPRGWHDEAADICVLHRKAVSGSARLWKPGSTCLLVDGSSFHRMERDGSFPVSACGWSSTSAAVASLSSRCSIHRSGSRHRHPTRTLRQCRRSMPVGCGSPSMLRPVAGARSVRAAVFRASRRVDPRRPPVGTAAGSMMAAATIPNDRIWPVEGSTSHWAGVASRLWVMPPPTRNDH